MSEIRFDYRLISIMREKIGNILEDLGSAMTLCGSLASSVEAGYAGEASADISIFIGIMSEHLNALIGLYSSAFSMAIGVADQVGALEEWLAAEERKYASELATLLEPLETEVNAE